MQRQVALGMLLAMLLVSSPRSLDTGAPCDGQPASRPLGPAAFRAILDTVAAGWNSARSDLAAGCFAEQAVYMEPPNRQLYRGRSAIRSFFAGSIEPARPDRMRWHAMAFDSVSQIGFGEYTYSGRQNYHGIVVVQLSAGLIQNWREYQYASPLSWEDFVGPSR
jgi:SnoaL-like domain